VPACIALRILEDRDLLARVGDDDGPVDTANTRVRGIGQYASTRSSAPAGRLQAGRSPSGGS
jgi:hypothetical protein